MLGLINRIKSAIGHDERKQQQQQQQDHIDQETKRVSESRVLRTALVHETAC
jgi:hypothetical protein